MRRLNAWGELERWEVLCDASAAAIPSGTGSVAVNVEVSVKKVPLRA